MTAFHHLASMAHSRLGNYVLPGLSSSLIGVPSADGSCVRLFEASRTQQTGITPHSHRFDFKCLILRGTVLNRIWTPHADGDTFQTKTITYLGTPGHYKTEPGPIQRWNPEDTMYREGDWYGMSANEVHSIFFSRDARVLFFEGPTVEESSLAIEPWVEGRLIETMKVEHWMFSKE